MKFKTVIDKKIKIDSANVYINVFVSMLNLVFLRMIPFACGVFLMKTRNLIFVLLFLLSIFMNIKIEYKDDEINIKIERYY